MKSPKIILAILALFLAANAHAKINVKLNFIDPAGTGMHLYPEAKEIMREAIDEVLSYLDDSYKGELKYDVCDMQMMKIPAVESYALFYNAGSLPDCGTNAYNKLVRRVSATDYEIIMVDLRQLWDFKFKDAQYKNVIANFKAVIMNEFLHALGIHPCTAGQFSPVIESKILRRQDGAYFQGENVKKLVKANSDPGIPMDTDHLHMRSIFPYDNCLIARYQSGYGPTRMCPYELAMLKDIGYKVKEFSETGSITPVVLASLDLSECFLKNMEVSLTTVPAAKTKEIRQGKKGLILGTYSPNAYIDFSISGILLASVPIRDAGCNVYDVCREDRSFQIIVNKNHDFDKNVFYVDAVIKERLLQNCMTSFLEYPLGVEETCLNQSNLDFLVLSCQDMMAKKLGFTVKLNKAVPVLENPHPYVLSEELRQNCQPLGHANYDSEVAIMKGKKVLAVLPFERLVENTHTIPIATKDGGGTLNILIKTRYDFKAKWIILEYITKDKDEL